MTQALIIPLGDFHDFDPLLKEGHDNSVLPDSSFLTTSSLTQFDVSFTGSVAKDSSPIHTTKPMKEEIVAIDNANSYLLEAHESNITRINEIKDSSSEINYSYKELEKLQRRMDFAHEEWQAQLDEENDLIENINESYIKLKEERKSEYEARLDYLRSAKEDLVKQHEILLERIELDKELDADKKSGKETYKTLKTLKSLYKNPEEVASKPAKVVEEVDKLEEKFNERGMSHLFEKAKALLLQKFRLILDGTKIKEKDFIGDFKNLVKEDLNFQNESLETLDFENSLKENEDSIQELSSSSPETFYNRKVERVESTIAYLEQRLEGLDSPKILETEYLDAAKKFDTYKRNLQGETRQHDESLMLLSRLEGLNLAQALADKDMEADYKVVGSEDIAKTLLESSKERLSLIELRSELVDKLRELDLSSLEIHTEKGMAYASEITFAIEVDRLMVLKNNYFKEEARLMSALGNLDAEESKITAMHKHSTSLIDGLKRYQEFLESDGDADEIKRIDDMLVKLEDSQSKFKEAEDKIIIERADLNSKLDNIEAQVIRINQNMSNIGEIGKNIASSTATFEQSQLRHIEVLEVTRDLISLLEEELKAPKPEEDNAQTIFIDEEENDYYEDKEEEEEFDGNMSLADELEEAFNSSLADELKEVNAFSDFMDGAFTSSTPAKPTHKRSKTVAWARDANGDLSFYPLDTIEEKSIAREALENQPMETIEAKEETTLDKMSLEAIAAKSSLNLAKAEVTNIPKARLSLAKVESYVPVAYSSIEVRNSSEESLVSKDPTIVEKIFSRTASFKSTLNPSQLITEADNLRHATKIDKLEASSSPRQSGIDLGDNNILGSSSNNSAKSESVLGKLNIDSGFARSSINLSNIDSSDAKSATDLKKIISRNVSFKSTLKAENPNTENVAKPSGTFDKIDLAQPAKASNIEVSYASSEASKETFLAKIESNLRAAPSSINVSIVDIPGAKEAKSVPKIDNMLGAAASGLELKHGPVKVADNNKNVPAAKSKEVFHSNKDTFNLEEFIDSLEYSDDGKHYDDASLLHANLNIGPAPAHNYTPIREAHYQEAHSPRTYDALVGAIHAANNNQPNIHQAPSVKPSHVASPDVADYVSNVFSGSKENLPSLANDISLDKLNSQLADELHANGYKIGEIFTEFITRRHLNGGMSGAIMAAAAG